MSESSRMLLHRWECGMINDLIRFFKTPEFGFDLQAELLEPEKDEAYCCFTFKNHKLLGDGEIVLRPTTDDFECGHRDADATIQITALLDDLSNLVHFDKFMTLTQMLIAVYKFENIVDDIDCNPLPFNIERDSRNSKTWTLYLFAPRKQKYDRTWVYEGFMDKLLGDFDFDTGEIKKVIFGEK